MALLLSPETYKLLEKRLGEDEAREIVKALTEAVQITAQKSEEAIARIENKADSLITQKKFELKDELTKELATKADIVNLEGVVKADIGVVKADVVRLEGVVKAEVERLEGMIKVIYERFNVIDERFKNLNYKLNLFIAIALLALTFANPTFVNLIERLFK
jgi:hypothetical protein